MKPSGSGPDTSTVVCDDTTVDGVANTGYAIYYNYNGQGWKLWNNFSGSQTSAAFDWKSTGYGDGPYAFEAVATNALGRQNRGKVLPKRPSSSTWWTGSTLRLTCPLVSRITIQ